MSAPKTNIDQQIARHRGPLFGMMAVGAFVAVLFLGWLFYETRGTDDTEIPPEEAAPTTTAPAATEPAPAPGPDAAAPVETAPATPPATAP